MIYVARVVHGVVVAVTVEPDPPALDGDQVAIGPDNTVGIGWRYEGGQFLAPPEAEERGTCEG